MAAHLLGANEAVELSKLRGWGKLRDGGVIWLRVAGHEAAFLSWRSIGHRYVSRRLLPVHDQDLIKKMMRSVPVGIFIPIDVVAGIQSSLVPAYG